jgi:fructose-bisphosphate aldolase class I
LSDADSIEYLNAINKRKNENPKAAPWALTFSFGRALQDVAMKAWSEGNIEDSQKKRVDRARWSGEAAVGKYAGGCPA